MGGVCSGGVMKKEVDYDTEIDTPRYSENLKKANNNNYDENQQRRKKKKKRDDSISISDMDHIFDDDDGGDDDESRTSTPLYHHHDVNDFRLSFSRELKPSTPARSVTSKVPQVSSLLGKAGSVGLEVLDTLGSSMSNLHPNSGFFYGLVSRGNRISILAFEVANTIVKGANLLKSLSEENIKVLKEEILHSDGVKKLVSTDMEELLTFAAADKRDEFDLFSREVVRFGDLCKDPQWHNLDRYFKKLDTDFAAHKQSKEDAEMTLQELMNLAQHTSELYHELPPLDRLEQDYQRKLEELQALNLPKRGESVVVLHGDLKQQRKHVKNLKKKSLWSKHLDEVVEKLVDIVTFIHQEIMEVFGDHGRVLVDKEQIHKPQRLGASGLCLHYANIINQIDSIVSRPNFLAPNQRDTLYQGLPSGIKTALRSQLQSCHAKEELTVQQIKAEMGKILNWLVPIALNTTKAHQGFGWVGEWANTGNDFNRKTTKSNSLMRIQTLYHAEKEKTEVYILELVIWLQRLLSQIRNRENGGFRPHVPVRSQSEKALVVLVDNKEDSPHNNKNNMIFQLSPELQDMLKDVSFRRLIPGVSKSQEFAISGTKKKTIKELKMSRSSGSSPIREFTSTNFLKHSKVEQSDVIDGLDTIH